MQTVVKISGMRCQSCVQGLMEAFRSHPEIISAKISLEPPIGVIESERPISIASLRAIADAAGEYQLEEREDGVAPNAPATERRWVATYWPLLLIVSLLCLACSLIEWRSGSWSWGSWMADFMGGFFVVFAFFKLLDVPKFVAAFRGYDILASRWPLYGHAYPYIELALGICYLARWQLPAVHAATLGLMLVGTIGVVRTIFARKRIQCACLGTVFDLPMSSVTVIENGTMAMMATWMLWMGA